MTTGAAYAPAWKLLTVGQSGRLSSPVRGHRWDTPTLLADDLPGLEDQHGIHVGSHTDVALSAIAGAERLVAAGSHVLAKVAIFGAIVYHAAPDRPDRYVIRAQGVTVITLHAWAVTGPAHRAAIRYGVPLAGRPDGVAW